jgi:hypothetical protein
MSMPEMPMPETDVAELIRNVNGTNNAVEDQYLRARQAADTAIRSGQAAGEAKAVAQAAAIAYQTIQAERPRRRSPLPRQVGLVAGTVAFDGVACYFAAQALNGGQDSTLIWTVLFLAVLAGGEIGLDFYRDRNLRAWRVLAWTISAFVVLLGVLRFWFLAVIGANDLVAAFTGAVLFTVVTAGFLTVGYRTLRAAETPQAWRARRAAHAATQAARAAWAAAKRDAAERDRLIDAYLRHIRKVVLKTCAVEQQLAVEFAVREHLSGRCP